VTDPLRAISRDVRDLGATLRPEDVEERGEGRLVAARGRSDEASTVVVDDDGYVLVAALVGDQRRHRCVSGRRSGRGAFRCHPRPG
jgi:hypothetical protein